MSVSYRRGESMIDRCTFMEDRQSRNVKTAKFNRAFSNLTIPVCTGSSRQEALIDALKAYESDLNFDNCIITNEWNYSNSTSMFVSADIGDFKIIVINSKSINGDLMITIVEGLCTKG